MNVLCAVNVFTLKCKALRALNSKARGLANSAFEPLNSAVERLKRAVGESTSSPTTRTTRQMQSSSTAVGELVDSPTAHLSCSNALLRSPRARQRLEQLAKCKVVVKLLASSWTGQIHNHAHLRSSNALLRSPPSVHELCIWRVVGELVSFAPNGNRL